MGIQDFYAEKICFAQIAYIALPTEYDFIICTYFTALLRKSSYFSFGIYGLSGSLVDLLRGKFFFVSLQFVRGTFGGRAFAVRSLCLCVGMIWRTRCVAVPLFAVDGSLHRISCGADVFSLLTPKGACQFLTTKQPAQISQTALGYYIEYFLFFCTVYLTWGWSFCRTPAFWAYRFAMLSYFLRRLGFVSLTIPAGNVNSSTLNSPHSAQALPSP